jgi:redox-sensing transcriptional repressor
MCKYGEFMLTQERISRLLNYKNLLLQLKGLGLVKVFSDNIADSFGISSSLVRRDFSSFMITGNQKGGYVIDAVLEKINCIIGKNEVQKVIIIGMGRIGEALINYAGFHNEGIEIVAGFDIDNSKVKLKRSVPVFAMDELESFVKENNIKIAILAVPNLAVQQVTEMLKQAGIKGILSFSSISFRGECNLTISNINIGNELENLIYRVNNNDNNDNTAE